MAEQDESSPDPKPEQPGPDDEAMELLRRSSAGGSAVEQAASPTAPPPPPSRPRPARKQPGAAPAAGDDDDPEPRRRRAAPRPAAEEEKSGKSKWLALLLLLLILGGAGVAWKVLHDSDDPEKSETVVAEEPHLWALPQEAGEQRSAGASVSVGGTGTPPPPGETVEPEKGTVRVDTVIERIRIEVEHVHTGVPVERPPPGSEQYQFLEPGSVQGRLVEPDPSHARSASQAGEAPQPPTASAGRPGSAESASGTPGAQAARSGDGNPPQAGDQTPSPRLNEPQAAREPAGTPSAVPPADGRPPGTEGAGGSGAPGADPPALPGAPDDQGKQTAEKDDDKNKKKAEEQCPETPKDPVVLVFDGSVSMGLPLAIPTAIERDLDARMARGDEEARAEYRRWLASEQPKRLDLAKSAVSTMLRDADSKLDMAAVAFTACREITTQPFVSFDERARIGDFIEAVVPHRGGDTALTASLQAALSIIRVRSGGGARGRIIMLTDGQETCGGDLCALGTLIKNSRPDIRVDVVDLSGRANAACVAEATGGSLVSYAETREITSLDQVLVRAANQCEASNADAAANEPPKAPSRP